jgi:hypothetical protein
MRKGILGLLLAAGTTIACTGQAPPSTPATILPLKTVRLYETGVGYFERTGDANPANGTSLPVPAGHLDDALKTLVVLGEGGQSSVGGLEFESSISEGMARALAGLSKEAGSPISHIGLLSSLKGDEVEVTTESGSFHGRVIEVLKIEPKPEAKPEDDAPEETKAQPTASPELALLLLTKANEIRRFTSDEIEAVRPTSPVTAARLGLALNTLSTRSAQTRRMLRIMARAKGPVTLGYIAEAPLWRTTYRVVLDGDGQRAVLQGWALLHNDTDEDWSKVRIQLVNGQPDSFLFPLAAPRYTRRDLATPSQDLSTIPQLLDKTPDAIWGDHADIEGESGAIRMGSIGTVGYGSGTGSGVGYGSGRGALSMRAGRSDLLEIGNLASIVQAEGIESGALFTYTLPQLLDLRAHGSALVPFIQSPVDAKPITWIDGAGADARMGVRFVNSTNQTLPPGPIAFFADGGFAGESALERLKPKERRYIEFGMDIDVESSQKTKSSSEEAKRLVYRNGSLVEHYIRKELLVFKIENRSGKPRSVHWVLGLVTNAKVDGPDEVTFDTSREKPVAVFELPPRKEIEREVRTEQGLSRSRPLRNIDVPLLDRLASETTLLPEQRKIVGDAAKRRAAVEETRKKKTRNEKITAEVEADLERLREHLKALGKETGGVATNPFVRRILAAEDRLTVLRTEKEALEEEEEKRLGDLEGVLELLTAEG